MRILGFALLVVVGLAPAGAGAAGSGLDTDAIGAAAGVAASTDGTGVVRLAWPRDDVPVTVNGSPLPAAAGLTSVTTLTPGPAGVLLVAEVIAFEDEVTPAVDAALAQGLAVSGLASRLPVARPPLQVLHLEGQGEAATLAAATKAVWDAARAVRQHSPRPAERLAGDPPKPGALDTAALEKRLGTALRAEGDVATATIAREVTVHRMRLGAAQGAGTRLWLVGGNEHAAVSGEIAMAAGEVQAVVRALRAGGLHLTGLHGHLVGEAPPLLFAAFWGAGPADALVAAVRGALDAQHAVRR